MNKQDFTRILMGTKIDGEKPSQWLIDSAWIDLEKQECINCGAKHVAFAIFLPKDSQKYGGVAGKQRLVFYKLCAEHTKEKYAEQNEAILLSRHSGEAEKNETATND